MKEAGLNQTSTGTIKAQWDEKYQGEPLSILRRRIGGFEVRFNPLRAHYMTSTQHAQIDTDVFCHKWEKIVANEKIGEITLPNFSWIFTTNTSPIEQYHSLLICAEHQEQEMTLECMNDLYAFSLMYPEMSVGFNGWKAGASQRHLHAQLFLSPLPITEWKNDELTTQVVAYPGICLTFSSPTHAFLCIEKVVQEEIPYNLLFTSGSIFIIPRKNENDAQYVKRGFDSVFGRIPVLTKDEYDQITLDDVRQILTSLMFQSLILDGETITLRQEKA